MAVTSAQTATVKPATSGAYLAASALYNAGFRGWALIIMTAIAGRESNWVPTRVNSTDPAGGSYGLLQINGSHNPDGGVATPSWASQILQPQQNADYAFSLAGGNSLSNLGPWALSSSPQSGVVPSPTVSGYSIAPYLAQAAVAAQQVTLLKPAPASQIANSSSWPGTAGATAAEEASLPADVQSAILDASQVAGGGCSGQPNIFSALGVTFTRCEAKGLLGGLAIGGGGALMITGLALIIVAAGKGKGPLAPVVQSAQGVASVAGWAKGLFSSGAATPAVP
jgi:hypothetical protein